MNKKLFKDFSESNKNLPFSLQYSWWNEVVKVNWDVSVVENQGQVKAIWPFFMRKKMGFTILGQPPITPYCGPFLVYPEGQKRPKRFSYEKKIHEQLIDQFPSYSYFEQNCNFQLKNTLPLKWNGFEQTSRYTYLLNEISNKENIYNGFAENLRREIKKAEKTINIIESDDVESLKKCIHSSFEAQNKVLPIDKKYIHRYHQYIQKYNCGKILLAVNDQNKTIGAVGIIWDKNSAYYLMGGADNEYKNSGALSLLLYKAILISSNQVQQFNFEGSIIPQIEKFFRSFGGELIPYSHIKHCPSKLFNILKSWK